jgi:hypothetical protein
MSHHTTKIATPLLSSEQPRSLGTHIADHQRNQAAGISGINRPSRSLLIFRLFLLAGIAILLWALVVFAQNNAGELSCTSREVTKGFIGNSDFYGLGIRIGVYLQWWASLITDIFVPSQWYTMIVSQSIFSLSLIIALIVLAFQHSCTFTVDIIIVLALFWGGIITISGGPSLAKRPYKPGLGFLSVLLLLLVIGCGFSTWFWLRLSTVGEADFQPTPGGSVLFLFAHVWIHNKAATGFHLFVAFLFGLPLVSGIACMVVGELCPANFFAHINGIMAKLADHQEGLQRSLDEDPRRYLMRTNPQSSQGPEVDYSAESPRMLQV